MATQHIKFGKFTENSTTLEWCDINFAHITYAMAEMDEFRNKYPWLSTIDEFGNTVLNSLQIPLVIKDLENLDNEVQNPKLTIMIQKAIALMKTAGRSDYIKFIGD